MVGFPRNATDKLSTACPRSPTIGGAHPSVGVSVAIGFGVGVVEGSSVVAIGAGVGAEVGFGVGVVVGFPKGAGVVSGS